MKQTFEQFKTKLTLDATEGHLEYWHAPNDDDHVIEVDGDQLSFPVVIYDTVDQIVWLPKEDGALEASFDGGYKFVSSIDELDWKLLKVVHEEV